MNQALKVMLDNYNCRSRQDYQNALKEIMQEIALLGLWRAKFFEHAAFYGGTALRILYGLDRFSEDIDFSLLKPNVKFDLKKYQDSLITELTSFGLDVDFESREKINQSPIKSAFIKANTLKNLLVIQTPKELSSKVHHHQVFKIKIEVDTDPPLGFKTEAKYLLQPIPFSINTFQLPDLFAGKMHAILCREWNYRIKGRDWYDLVWYIGRQTPLRLLHLEKRIKQTGHLQRGKKLTESLLKQMLKDKIAKIDFELAKQDVMPFLKDPQAVQVWSQDFFRRLILRLEFV